MNKKVSLLALGLTLMGVLIYFMASGTQPDKPPVVADTSAPSISDNPSVTVESSLPEEHLSPQESVISSGDDTGASLAARLIQQQAPALEPGIREALGKMLNTSSEGLVEETRNGVTSVDLQGRFQTVPVATIDENGNVQITDYSHLPKVSTRP